MTKIKLFQDKKIRSVWNEDEEQWYFSVVDVVGALTDSPNPRQYWRKMKDRDLKEYETYPFWVQLKCCFNEQRYKIFESNSQPFVLYQKFFLLLQAWNKQ